MRILIITEKPSVAQKIAYALKKDFQTLTKKQHKRVTYYELKNENTDLFITPAVGHLFSLKEKQNTIPVFELEWVPSYLVNKSSYYIKDYLDNIVNLIKNADLVINATDFDIEGSLIGYNIIKKYGDVRKAKRMKFSTVTPQELYEAYKNLIDFDIDNAYAGEARHTIDWFYGINLSRSVMNAIKKSGRYKSLSIGRVQGPMLHFLVKREEEIENFKPELYWVLNIIAKDVQFSHTKNPFKSKKEAETAKENTSKKGKIKINSTIKKIPPPPPFDFTTLQTEAYRIYGFIPVKTQEISQSLYEKGMISYPRSASQKLPPQINVKSIIYKLSENPKFSKLAKELIEENKFKPKEGKKEDVHPAIHPTGETDKISTDEEKIYNLIVHRFLSCFADYAEIKENNITLDATEIYSTKISETVKEGWQKFYPYLQEKKETNPFIDGEEVSISKVTMKEKETTPPQRYTPASILQLMEKENIGTKTTRAIVLDTLYKRGYVVGKQITVTPLGRVIYKIFKKYSPKILDPNLTRQLEEEMEKIQNKEISKEKTINDAKEIVTSIIHDILQHEKEIGTELKVNLEESEKFAPCACGGNLKVIDYKGKKFLGCTNYPKCKITFSLPPSYLFTYAGQCDSCNSPKIWIIKGKQRYQKCLNQNCISNKRKEETESKKEKK
ncbi:MAG: DNA topoisomerase I [Candidatus Micrarchaeota archaeon]|nr:DNA topoisomerase I [Candidatus Micrarchaeota archaeon]